MLRKRPGVFVAGEMIDWEAPTGGYLLQACVRDRRGGWPRGGALGGQIARNASIRPQFHGAN